MLGYSKDWTNAWIMLHKITEQVFDDCGNIYFKKNRFATYKKAKKRDITEKYIQTSFIADTINEWYDCAIYNQQNAFRIYNKYNEFSYQRLINFFKNPDWQTAQVIACSAILKHKEEQDEIYGDIIKGLDSCQNRFEIAKQWRYRGNTHATTIFGNRITMSTDNELPVLFDAVYKDGLFTLVK